MRSMYAHMYFMAQCVKYMCAHIPTYVRTYACAHTHTHTYTHQCCGQRRPPTRIHQPPLPRRQMPTLSCVCVCVCVCVRRCVYMYTHTHIHTCMHAHTHTHTLSLSLTKINAWSNLIESNLIQLIIIPSAPKNQLPTDDTYTYTLHPHPHPHNTHTHTHA